MRFQSAEKFSASNPQLFLIMLDFFFQIALIFIVHQFCFCDTGKENKVMFKFCLRTELMLVVASNVT